MKGIAVTAYSPLGSQDSPLLENAVVTKIAKKHDASPANILVSLQANKPGVNGTSPSLPPTLPTQTAMTDLSYLL